MSKVTNKTVLVMIDTVTSPTGLKMPFEKIVKKLESKGINVLLDAAHGIGMVDLNLDEMGASLLQVIVINGCVHLKVQHFFTLEKIYNIKFIH